MLTSEQRIHVVRLQQEIARHFQMENQIELQLGAPDDAIAFEVVGWARDSGFLAQCISGRLIVKCASRYRNGPLPSVGLMRHRLVG